MEMTAERKQKRQTSAASLRSTGRNCAEHEVNLGPTALDSACMEFCVSTSTPCATGTQDVASMFAAYYRCELTNSVTFVDKHTNLHKWPPGNCRDWILRKRFCGAEATSLVPMTSKGSAKGTYSRLPALWMTN